MRKNCLVCGTEFEALGPNKSCSPECKRLRKKTRRVEFNRENKTVLAFKKAKYDSDRYKKNRDKIIEQRTAYYTEKRAQIIEYTRKWYHARRNNSVIELLKLLKRGELSTMGHPCFVYMFYGNGLLYVGITNNPERRLYQHAQDKSWFDQIQIVKLAAFATETEAMTMEAFLIKSLRPAHNVAHNVAHNGSHFAVVDQTALLELMLKFVSVDLLSNAEAA